MSTRNFPRQIRSISLESLESRLNLSTLTPVSFATTTPAAQAARARLVKIQSPAKRAAKLNGVASSALSTVISSGASDSLGATGIGSSSTSVSISDYSAISNSQLEYTYGVPDIGYDSTSGSYVEYTLNVQTAGTYNISLGTAETGNAQIALSVNGTQSATYSLASTGSWSNFSANTTQSVYLPAGSVVVRLSTLNGTQYNLGSLNVSPATNVTTVTSSTTSVPVTGYSSISNSQLEYTYGVPDIGYDSTSGSNVEYTLNVKNAGNYNITLGTAETGNAQVALSVNGTQSATYSLASTGSWSNFSANTTQSVYLPAGSVVLRLFTLNGTQYNLGSLNIAPASSSTTTTSTTASTTTSNASAGFDATVSTQWMTSFNQLNIVAGSANDTVAVSQSGNTITVNVNGVSNSYTGSFGDIVVKAGSGNDNITIDGSVNIATLLYGGAGNDTLKNFTSGYATIVSIGGGADTVQGNGVNTAYWVDSSDTVTASGTEASAGDIHKVSSFWNGVSTTLAGQTFTEPTGTGTTTTVSNASLWGTGPTMTDINQGQVADCFLLAPLQSMANTEPGTLRQLAVDLGDGTYAVQFKRNGVTTCVRVDGQLPSNGYYVDGLMYAHPGASGDIWAPIIEKAYAEFRTGAYSYSSLNWGSISAVLSDFGISYSNFSAGNTSSLYNTIASAISSGKDVAIGTNATIASGAPLIGAHAYSVTAAWTDSSGTKWVTLRNPWGFDGAGSDSNPSDGFVTMTISQLNANLATGSVFA